MTTWTSLEQKLMMWIEGNRGELIERTQEMLRIESVKGPGEPGSPFGTGTNEALNYALNIANSYGLSVKNLDGFAGHAEWVPKGIEGPCELVGVLAHVDVVPAGSGWKHPAFGAEIDAGRIYARGAIDDKGPAMAALYAIIALKQCDMLGTRRVRLILGADEESGFQCVKHYFENEEMPDMGFTPDADFPLIFAEKGIVNVAINMPIPKATNGFSLSQLTAGLRSNMVPDSANAIVEVDERATATAVARLNSVVGIVAKMSPDGVSINVASQGVSAHGSTPELGINAVGPLCDSLLLLDLDDDLSQFLTSVRSLAVDTSGTVLGIDGSDSVSGSLTCNLGTITCANGIAQITFNIRYPVSWNIGDVLTHIQEYTSRTKLTFEEKEHHPPLHVPQDDPLVRTLLSVYREDTGDDRPPISIGGGTYARVMRKGVAFGPEFPGGKGGAHEHDESWGVEELIRASKIYAKALLRLINA